MSRRTFVIFLTNPITMCLIVKGKFRIVDREEPNKVGVELLFIIFNNYLAAQELN